MVKHALAVFVLMLVCQYSLAQERCDEGRSIEQFQTEARDNYIYYGQRQAAWEVKSIVAYYLYTTYLNQWLDHWWDCGVPDCVTCQVLQDLVDVFRDEWTMWTNLAAWAGSRKDWWFQEYIDRTTELQLHDASCLICTGRV